MERMRLRGRIVERYGTFTRFASEIGITKQTVTNVLNGRTTPTSKKMPVWCAALDISPEEVGYFFTIAPQKSEA